MFQAKHLQQLWPQLWPQQGWVSPLCSWATESWLMVKQAWTQAQISEHNYWAASTAPADALWQTVTDLADLATWHPLITRTNAPRGQRAKPGLIYRAFSRYAPISAQIFVERVLPGELLSVRVFLMPGVQERATYRIVSTICGTCVLYSVTLSGWLSPLLWPMVRPQVDQVATSLVHAAEQASLHPKGPRQLYQNSGPDIFQ
ncbi:MAG: SRPBCC family protein [Cyanobacteria bacterium J06614_10]